MMDGCKDPKEKEFLDEVSKSEKQLWALVNSKGLSHPDVRKLYHRVCCSYETMILHQDLQLSQLQEIEYSLWKLHYKHIDEFRKNRNLDCESFLSDASHFYSNLLLQLPSKWIPKCRFLSHRFLICLGDLARYKKQLIFTKPDIINTDYWSVAARHYSEACFAWPDSGNPHNQLALLATYVGDDLLALYHFVRSLAAKEPFLDSSNNLMLILQKSRSCSDDDDDETPFDFLRPHKRMKPRIKEGQSCRQNEVWPRLVRIMSFFYTKPSRLEEFPSGFAATIRDVEMLMELDDRRLEEALMNSHSNKWPVRPRAIQAVCIFIFLVQNFLKKPLWTSDKEENEDDPMLRVYAFCSTFIFMGRLVDRCTEGSVSCSLLPSVVIFMEWLVTMFDQVKLASSFSSEEEKAAMSYFLGSLSLLLNRLENDHGGCETQFQHSSSSSSAALWPEDFELRGFSPMEPVHDSLDFSSTSSGSKSHRTYRAIAAAKRIVGDFVGNWDTKCSAAAAVEEEEEEEQEVILFKPLTRYNSAPIHHREEGGVVVSSNSTVGGSDEVLRRATSLLSPQNHNPAVVMKGKEAPSSVLRDVGNGGGPMAAGPPSLSAWVINSGGIQEMSNATFLSPINDDGDDNDDDDDDNDDEVVIIPTNYSAPIPSAPLLPEDATWFHSIEEDNGILENTPPPPPPPQDNNNLYYYSTELASSSSNDDVVVYPISCGMSSSEWLRQFREMNNLQGGNFEAPSWGLQCRAGKILGNQQRDYLPIHPQLPRICQKPSKSPYGTEDKLQYFKDTQLRRLQQDPSFQTRMFLGN